MRERKETEKNSKLNKHNSRRQCSAAVPQRIFTEILQTKGYSYYTG